MSPEIVTVRGRTAYRCKCKRSFDYWTLFVLHTLDGTCPRELFKKP